MSEREIERERKRVWYDLSERHVIKLDYAASLSQIEFLRRLLLEIMHFNYASLLSLSLDRD